MPRYKRHYYATEDEKRQHPDDHVDIRSSELVIKHLSQVTTIPYAEIIEIGSNVGGGFGIRLSCGRAMIGNYGSSEVNEMILLLRDMVRRVNPDFERSPQVSLTLPADRDARVHYGIRAQRLYGKRYPSYSEFQRFLEANLDWVFAESTYYACSMSMCVGRQIREFGWEDDEPVWFREYERINEKVDKATGKQLLDVLRGIHPDQDSAG